MAIISETSRIVYTGNNSTVTPYPVTFQFLNDVDLMVVVTTSAGAQTTLALGPDYTITGSGYPMAEASITTAVAVPASSTVTIFRDTAFTQTAEYVEADEFPADSHERALDKLTMLSQELEESRQRAFRLTLNSPMIPALQPVNNALLGLDPDGVPFFKTASEVLTWLQLVQTLGNFPTKTFANAAERTIAVPDFLGQVGTQRDTNTGYIGTALSAGAWSPGVSSVADAAITTAKLAVGALSADAAGRLKMATAYLMASHLNADIINSQTADTFLDDGDKLLGYNGAELRSYAGDVIVPPGTIIQTIAATPYTANANLSTVIPVDDTIPQITEGTQILSVIITPRFSNSQIALTFNGFGVVNAVTSLVAALFKVPVSNALTAIDSYVDAINVRRLLHIDWIDSPATTSATTYTIRVGPGTAGTARMNGHGSARMFGGAAGCILRAQEIKV